MVVVKVGDGLGNQIYNYFCGYSVAKLEDDILLLDTSECDNSENRKYLLDYFNIDYCLRESLPNKNTLQKIYKRLRRNIKYKVIKENSKQWYQYDKRVFSQKKIRNKYLYGYWQNVNFFYMYKQDFLRQFYPKNPMRKVVCNLMHEFRNMEVCAVHFRGGDIEMPKLSYFRNAVSIIEKKYNVRYIIFSNAIEEAKEVLEQLDINYTYIGQLGEFSDIEEFMLMRSCKYMITSDSTFSRCAGLLNFNENCTVIAPSLGNIKTDMRVYPENWIIL